MEQLGVFLVLIFVIIINLVIAQDLNPYHYIIKGFVRKNFKCVQEHGYDEVLNGVSDKQLEHTFAGDNCLGGTRRDKEIVEKRISATGINPKTIPLDDRHEVDDDFFATLNEKQKIAVEEYNYVTSKTNGASGALFGFTVFYMISYIL